MNLAREILKKRRDLVVKRITRNSLEIERLEDQICKDVALLAMMDNSTVEKDDFYLIQIHVDMRSKHNEQ